MSKFEKLSTLDLVYRGDIESTLSRHVHGGATLYVATIDLLDLSPRCVQMRTAVFAYLTGTLCVFLQVILVESAAD